MRAAKFFLKFHWWEILALKKEKQQNAGIIPSSIEVCA